VGTPTILAKDRSLAICLALSIAHCKARASTSFLGPRDTEVRTEIFPVFRSGSYAKEDANAHGIAMPSMGNACGAKREPKGQQVGRSVESSLIFVGTTVLPIQGIMLLLRLEHL
jgi:hypothetical protein